MIYEIVTDIKKCSFCTKKSNQGIMVHSKPEWIYICNKCSLEFYENLRLPTSHIQTKPAYELKKHT